MKIIHIAGGGDRGGAKTHIISLCSRLAPLCDLTLASMRSGEFADDAAKAGIRTETFFSGFTPRDYLRLVKWVRREQPDLVHCHGAKANIAGVLVKFFCRRTIVTTVHSDYRLDYMQSFLRRNTIGRLNAWALRRFDHYVTVSDRFCDMLIERGFSPLKIHTIYNGLDFSVTAPREGRAEYLREAGLDYEEGDVVVGIPARLTAVKDIPTLLRAFAKARSQNSRLKLMIGGDGEESDSLKALAAELGLGKSVCFCGWVYDVPRFFAACDIDVLCSISESFPYSVLEGIREGCAVITSDVGGMNRLIDHGENGYIFAPRDTDAFAGYLLELSQDADKRRAFASALRAKASAMFSLENMAQTQMEIYGRITEAQRKARRGVLICGAYGRGNSGDEAILRAVIGTMRELDPHLPITVMTRKPMPTKLMYRTDAVYTFDFPAFLRAMRRSRLFINGGGSLIQDVTSSRSLFFYLYTLRAAKKRGCRVLMYGCGIGPVTRRFDRRLARRVMDRYADIITLRDETSLRELRELGVSAPDMRLSADPALSLAPAESGAAESFMAAQGLDPAQKYICFCVRPWRGFHAYDIFARAAEYAYEKYGLRCVLLPAEYPRDLAVSEAVAAEARTPCHVLRTPDDVTLTVAVLKRMSAVCAMRLHALIFSASVSVPFIATSYDAKVAGFMEYIGSPLCCELDELSAEWLCERIDRIMADPASYAEACVRLRELERKNLAAARELLEK